MSVPEHAEIAVWVMLKAGKVDPALIGGFSAGLDMGFQIALRHPEYARAITDAHAVRPASVIDLTDEIVRTFPIEVSHD